MDFTAALANLEKSAEQASRSGGHRGNQNNHNNNNNHNSNNYYDNHQDGHRSRVRPPEHRPHYTERRHHPRARYHSPNHHHHRNNNDNDRYRRRGGRGGGGRYNNNNHHQNNHHHHSSDHGSRQYHDRPLEALADCGYRCLPYRPLPIDRENNSADNNSNSPKHIGLLAITIDELPYEHIWREWAHETTRHGHTVSLLGHAKYPHRVTSPWWKQRLLTEAPKPGRGNSLADPVFHTHVPEWGSVQITRAMIDLLAAAMEIGRSTTDEREKDERFSRRRHVIADALPAEVATIDKFIFVSETCLPATTLDELVEALFASDPDYRLPGQSRQYHMTNTVATDSGNDNTTTTTTTKMNPFEVSWVNARNRQSPGTPRNKYERDQFSNMHRMIPQSMRWKADQWLVLSRPHAAAVLDMDQHLRPHEQLWKSFVHVNASDEMYFPTILACLQILTESTTSQPPPTTTAPENDNNNSNNPDADHPKPQLHPPAIQVMLRPVTYTDWTEGMRNPATFAAKDLKRVLKAARREGCLLARKFSPVTGTGQPAGDIAFDHWRATLTAVQADLEKLEALNNNSNINATTAPSNENETLHNTEETEPE